MWQWTTRADPERGQAGAGLAHWRSERLRAAGFAADLADGLAADPATDVHALIELVERGCPPELAVRILAPLEGEEQP